MRRIVVIAVGEVEDDDDLAALQTEIGDVVGVDAVALIPGQIGRVELPDNHTH